MFLITHYHTGCANYCNTHSKFVPDADVEDPEVDPTDLLLLCGDNNNSPTLQSSPPPPPSSPAPHSSPSPSRSGPTVQSHSSTSRSQRGRVGRGQLFDDPAVVKTVEGRPSLKVHLMF